MIPASLQALAQRMREQWNVFWFPERCGQRVALIRRNASVAECAAELRVQQMWMHLN